MKKPGLPVILFIGVAAISTAALFVRFAQDAGAPSLIIASSRLLISGIVLLIINLATGNINQMTKLRKRDWTKCFFASLFLGLHFASWVSSLEYTSVMSSSVLVTTTPVWIAVLSPLFLKEKSKPLTIIGLCIALVGGLLITINNPSSAAKNLFWGNSLAVFGAFMAAGYFMMGRQIKAEIPLLTYLLIIFSFAGVLLLSLAMILLDSPLQLPIGAWKWLLLTALIPQLIGHSLANYALQRLSASFVAITWLGEPIGATALAMILLREYPDIDQILGGFIILGGILIASLAERIVKEGSND